MDEVVDRVQYLDEKHDVVPPLVCDLPLSYRSEDSSTSSGVSHKLGSTKQSQGMLHISSAAERKLIPVTRVEQKNSEYILHGTAQGTKYNITSLTYKPTDLGRIEEEKIEGNTVLGTTRAVTNIPLTENMSEQEIASNMMYDRTRKAQDLTSNLSVTDYRLADTRSLTQDAVHDLTNTKGVQDTLPFTEHKASLRLHETETADPTYCPHVSPAQVSIPVVEQIPADEKNLDEAKVVESTIKFGNAQDVLSEHKLVNRLDKMKTVRTISADSSNKASTSQQANNSESKAANLQKLQDTKNNREFDLGDIPRVQLQKSTSLHTAQISHATGRDSRKVKSVTIMEGVGEQLVDAHLWNLQGTSSDSQNMLVQQFSQVIIDLFSESKITDHTVTNCFT